MSARQRELAARREALRAEATLQREFLSSAAVDLQTRLVSLDRGIAIARQVVSKPLVVAGGVALIALIGPRRLLSFASRSAFVVSAGRKVMGMLGRSAPAITEVVRSRLPARLRQPN